MRIIDPGHKYACRHLDGDGEEIITFVKREGLGYPGNVGHHPGTNLQEGFRVFIDRVKYLNSQDDHWANHSVIKHLRNCIEDWELRAAERHGRVPQLNPARWIENEPTCSQCGHIGCGETCHAPERSTDAR